MDITSTTVSRRAARALVTILTVVAASLAAAGSAPPQARAATYVPWSTIAPGLPLGYDATSRNVCRRGDPTCVNSVIHEMQLRFGRLAPACDHNAVFSLAYLRTTQMFKRFISQTPPFFHSNPFVIYEDAVFAQKYFTAFDAWKAGRTAAVPPAWQIAFHAAATKDVSGAGDLLLGINAHVNRDLAFALYQIGLTEPDGTSLKPDHDKVNQILGAVLRPLLIEEEQRFDPSISNAVIDGAPLTDTALLQILVAWREEAWRNAQRLAAAPDAAARAQVAQSIEQAAAVEAKSIVAQTQYDPPLTSSAQRDAWCAVHWSD